MHVVVAGAMHVQEMFASICSPGHAFTFICSVGEIVPADAVIVLYDEADNTWADAVDNGIPVFVNSVTGTAAKYNLRCTRFNGWPGFLQNPVELFAPPELLQQTRGILTQLGIHFRQVPDLAGFISARIISSVINEAYFTLGEGIASRQDIDLAMKLGTNYPFGPFEWAEKIGLPKIHSLLSALGREQPMYKPAPQLETEIVH